MRRFAFTAALLAFAVTPLAAQQHVVDPTALDQAIAQQGAQDQAQRAALLSALDRPEAQQAASRLGVNLQDARTAVSTLDGTELSQLSRTLQTGERLSGGDRTIVISTTTLLLLIIIVILLAT